VQMLDEDPQVSAEVKSWVETIGRNVQLEARLIDDLLDLTRITNGKLELHAGLVDIHKLIYDTIEICGDEIRVKELELSLALDARQSTIEEDSARLQQVLWNLLKNAVKFTPEHGSISIRTSNTVSADGRYSMLRCQITDTGIGIPSEHLTSVFNAFDQGGKAITRRFGGLGLGLAISKALVEQHHGAIWAESDGQEKGATFSIEMPTATIPKVPPSEKTPSIESSIKTAVRILLVEDNDDTSRAMQVLFERKGFHVEIARSVESALELSNSHPIDLVISDIGLPDGDGFEVIKHLNEIRPTRGIAISGFGMDEDRRRSLEAGFNAHLVKPVNFTELSGIVQKLLAEV
ncbi:MAG: ATP-binding protein, partial [Candidatus Kapaibacterium sp.]